MTKIPQAIWEGTFTLFRVKLRCSVLDDEAHTRVIDCEDVAYLFHAMELGGDTMPLDDEELAKFFRWERGGRIDA